MLALANYVHLNVYIDKPSFEQHSNSEQETKKFVKELIEGVTRKYTSALNYHLIVHELVSEFTTCRLPTD